jgi:hypothetical protein
MIQDTIQRIEQTLASADLEEGKRRELTELLATLRQELGRLSEQDVERAQSVAGFAEVSSREATRKQSDPELVDLSLQGFHRSVQDLEEAHPSLVKVVNSFCQLLSNSGI